MFASNFAWRNLELSQLYMDKFYLNAEKSQACKNNKENL